MADHGVLFLDELPEFDRDVLEALREPLEDGHVAIARVGRAAIFPARFQLVAAMNPCPCGYAGTDSSRCHCRDSLVERYAERVSGPLRDRIDLWVTMPRVAPASLVSRAEPESSASVAARIASCRDRQVRRRGRLNSRLSGRALRGAARLGKIEERRLVALSELEGLSARGTERLLRVARTIADLAEAESVDGTCLEEAARYRSPASVAAQRLAG